MFRKLFLTLGLLLGLAPLGLAQASNYNIVIDSGGHPVSNAIIRVYAGGSCATACSYVNIYSDYAETHLINQVTSPVVSDAGGNYFFFTSVTPIDVQIVARGITSTYANVTLSGNLTLQLSSPPPIGNVAPNTVYATNMYVKNGQPWYDAIANGAFGDGNPAGNSGLGTCAHDDTAALQAVINAACGSGRSGTAFIPQGNYCVSSTLYIPVQSSPIAEGRECGILGSWQEENFPANVNQSTYTQAPLTWRGSAIINTFGGDTLAFDTTNGNAYISGITIKGVTFVMQGFLTGNHIRLKARNGHNLHNITVRDSAFVGGLSAFNLDTDSASGAWWITLDHNFAYAQAGNPFSLVAGAGVTIGNPKIVRNWVAYFGTSGSTQCASSYSGCGIYLSSANNVVISEGNEVSNQAYGNGIGIRCAACQGGEIKGNDVEAEDYGILLDGNGVDISGNKSYCVAQPLYLNVALNVSIGANNWYQGTGCPANVASPATDAVLLTNSYNLNIVPQWTNFAGDISFTPVNTHYSNIFRNDGSYIAGLSALSSAGQFSTTTFRFFPSPTSSFSTTTILAGFAIGTGNINPCWVQYRPTGDEVTSYPWYLCAGGGANDPDYYMGTAASAVPGAETPVFSWYFHAADLTFHSAGGFAGGEFFTPASTTTNAGLNVPAGTAPTSPVNGDLWTTAAGLYIRINGATVGPFTAALSGTTSTITGSALTATCDSGTATVTGATVGETVTVSTTDGTDVGGAFYLRASVTSSNTVTVYVCGTGTPSSKAYNVRVIP